MRALTLSLSLLTITLTATTQGAVQYFNFKWASAGEYQFEKGENELAIKAPATRYLRLRFYGECAELSYTAYAYRTVDGEAEAVPLTFDREATEYNPKYLAHYYGTTWNKAVAIDTLLLDINKMGPDCTIHVATSTGAPVTPPAEEKPKVYSEGRAQAEAEYIAKEIAVNRTVDYARRLCRTAKVQSVDDTFRCTVVKKGLNPFDAHCFGWFYCVK